MITNKVQFIYENKLIELENPDPNQTLLNLIREKKKTLTLNEDGRADKPLLEGKDFLNGKYELVFFIGDYFKNITKSGELPFLDDVIIRFGISNSKEHYHVPLLVSPWSYSTYRGS